MTDEKKSRKFLDTGGWVLFVILPLIIGSLLSLLIPKPIIGIIYLDDAIYSYTAQDMIEQIIYAREHDEIRAVVLVMYSPGGTVVDTESVYLELARLREVKPVVTMVEGMAASGGYYLAVGTDYIIANPSSSVGNVGVIGTLPSSPAVFEETYSTGPYKLWGYPRDTYVREMEMLKEGFLSAILLGRGERLLVSTETLLRGQIWTGSDGLRMGLVDQLGAQSEAFEKAAEMAHVSHYEVEDLYLLAEISPNDYYTFYYESPEGVETVFPREGGLYYLYIPPVEVLP